MEKFTKLTGVAAPLNMINVDTDMIIPKQFLKTIKRSGLGKHLFDEMRFNRDGSETEGFILNAPAYREASILVAGDNFGCGSSREHAPWALLDFGIKCVISTSFADIFYNNCFKNGMLPIALSELQVEDLFERAANYEGYAISVDLHSCKITDPHGLDLEFEVESFRRHCLLNGLDDIGLTLEHEDKIALYEAKTHGLVSS